MKSDASAFAGQVSAVLDEIRPSLALHGGSIELLDADPATGRVRVRLTGACAGCPFADETMAGLVELTLKERVPEVTEVVSDPVAL